MHIESLRAENVRHLEPCEHAFSAGQGAIRKWTVLEATDASHALLRCVALAGLGRRQMLLLACSLNGELVEQRALPAHLEFVLIRHAPQERMPHSPVRQQSGWHFWADGRVAPVLKPAFRSPGWGARFGRPDLGRSHHGRLVVGYGRQVIPHVGTDQFDIYPDQRLRRCAGLFDAAARVTDPLAFLDRLRRKSCYRAGRARALLARLSADLSAWLGWDVADLLARPDEFAKRWHAEPATRRTPAIVLLDVARHVYDAAEHLADPDPLTQPGVVLLAGADAWCPGVRLNRFLELLDARFPRLQFLITLSASGRRQFPTELLRKRLPVPEAQPRPRPVPVRRLAPATVLLVDVDSTLPNLALMKLSRGFKAQGRRVVLARGVQSLPMAGTILASCVFNTPGSAKRVEILRRRYGDTLVLGGSGVDLGLRLAPEVEALAADYSLYPELGDRAVGFLTRGCPQHCPFCIVPKKEGPPRRVSDLDTLLQGRKKLILLDDNLLAHADGPALLEEMARRRLQVNFNQTLDLRRLTPETAGLLRRVSCANAAFTRRTYHFSLNDARGLERVRQQYALLQTTPSDNVEFVCMYGFNTTLAEDVERFRFLRSLPGAYVFVQRYQPVPGGPPADLQGYFDERADGLLSELVHIVYRQNMKSMETYYRWLALQYAAQCGRIHAELVETLFRYNGRSRMGGFLHRLGELCKVGATEISPRS
ncbi:MAG: hypothetical protein M5U12_31205 [Verrucomicrobia bacterium]|nr:hypothetical protein [Verrucomicrobiota bacterium]